MSQSCKYTWRKARFQHASSVGYWVTLYLIYDGERCYIFYNESDFVDNSCLMSETCSITSFIREILVTPTQHSSIFREIYDFDHELCV